MITINTMKIGERWFSKS